MGLHLIKRLFTIFLLEFVLIAAFAILSYQNFYSIIQQTEESVRREEVKEKLSALSSSINEMEALSRGYVISQNNRYRYDLRGEIGVSKKYILELKALMKDKQQINKLEILSRLVVERIVFAEELIQTTLETGFSEAKIVFDEGMGDRLSSKIDELIEEMIIYQTKLKNENKVKIDAAIKLSNILLLSILIVFLLIAIVTYGYSRRITQKLEKKENELIESEFKFKQLVENTNAIPWEVDYNTFQFTYVGPQAERVLGYAAEMWLQKNFWPNHIHPDDKDKALDFCLHSSKTLKNYNFEYRMIAQDGSEIWLHDIVNVYWEDAKPKVLRGFLIDITEAKKVQLESQANELKMNLINQQLPCIIWTMDKKYILTSSIGADLIKLELKSGDVNGMTIYEYLGIEENNTTSEALIAHNEALRGKSSSYDIELNNLVWRANLEPMRDSSGEITSVVGLAIDITEIKNKEKEEVIKAENLLQLNNALTDITRFELTEFEKFIGNCTEIVSKLLNVERVGVWMLNDEKESLICEDLYVSSFNKHLSKLMIPTEKIPGYLDLMKDKRIISISDSTQNEEFEEYSEIYLFPNSIVSLLDAPIKVKENEHLNEVVSLIESPIKAAGSIVGVFSLRHVGKPRIWSKIEEDFAVNVADLITLSIEATARKRTEIVLKETLDNLEELVEARTLELTDVNKELLKEIKLRELKELELIQNEEKYKKLIETAGDVIYTTDIDGNFIFLNERTEKLCGYTAEELIGKHFTILIQEEWRAKLMEFYKNQFKSRIYETIHSFPIVCKNGELKWIEQSVIIITEGNRIIGFQSMVRDITERKKAEDLVLESENRIKTIIENAPDAIIVINNVGIIKEWNEKAELIFGWKKEEVIEKPMHQYIIPKRYVNKHLEGLKHYKLTGEGRILNRPIEIEAINKEGKEFKIELTISPNMVNGEAFFISFLRDITERKKNEGKINRLNKELENSVVKLEAANKELEAFSYSVSHDLRAPLRGINGFTKILLDEYNEKIDDEGKRLLEVVKSSADKMGTLIDDLLAFSRTGRAEVKMEAINMNNLVEGTIAEIERNWGKLKTKITVDELPEALGDFALVKQVLSNLISNAVKFSSGIEDPQVKIGATKEGKEIIYFVQDNGVGFDLKYSAKLFGVFQRLHTEAEFEGTGVGLAVVKRIIEKHGGKVWAEAAVNKGATFFFTLPAEVKDEEEIITKDKSTTSA